MIAIPFVYFSFVTFILYSRRKIIDLATTISLIFAFSGFCSILIDVFSLRYGDSVYYKLGLEAAIVYCGLLTICLLPFIYRSHLSFFSFKKMKNERLLRFLAWFALLWFIITLFFSWHNMMNVLMGDMNELRRMAYQGEGQESWMLSLPAPIRFIFAVINSVFGCKWTLIFLAFYSRYVQRLPNKYMIMFLLASLIGPIQGIIGADRSSTAYWIMSLVGMFLLFRPFISQKDKKRLLVFASFIVGLLMVYLFAMTLSRFGERDEGASGGLISYFGQSYINFCLFYEKYEPPFINLGLLFPFTYHYLLDLPSGAVLIQRQMADLTGFDTGVFYTFIGQIIVAAGRIVAITFCFIYTLCSYLVLKRVVRHKQVSAASLYIYFAFISVLYLGPFVYYYSSSTITFGLIAMYILIKLMK